MNTPRRLVEAADKGFANTKRRVSYTHNPYASSAWLDCERCQGTGHIEVADGEDDATHEVGCPDCKGGVILYGECLRASFWRMNGTVPSDPMDAAGWWNMKSGDAVEWMFAEVLKKYAAFAQQVEVWWESPLCKRPFHGYQDFVIIGEKVPGLIIADSKKVKGYAAKQIRKNNEIKKEHFLQLCSYVRGDYIRFPYHPIEWIKLLAFDPASSYRAEVDMRVTEDVVMDVTDRIATRARLVENHLGLWGQEAALPEPEYKDMGTKGPWTHWKCRIHETRRDKDGYCGWRHKCQALEREEADDE